MPRDRDERADAKRDAERTANYFDRLVARGLSRKEACDLTVAYVLGGMARADRLDPEHREPKEPWE